MSKKNKKQTDYRFRIEREIEKGREVYYLFVKFERWVTGGVQLRDKEIGQVWFLDELSNTLNLELQGVVPRGSRIYIKEGASPGYAKKYRKDFRAILHEWGGPVEASVTKITYPYLPEKGVGEGMLCHINREIHTGQVGVVWVRHSAWRKKKWYKPAMEFLKNMVESEMSSNWRRRFKEGP